MKEKAELRRADIVTGSLLLCLGGWFCVKALNMPWSGSANASMGWYLSPGLFPLICGALMIVLSLRVLANAVAEGALAGFAGHMARSAKELCRSRSARNTLFCFGMLVAYVGLLGRLNYEALSAGFIFLLVLYFWLSRRENRSLKKLAGIAALAVAFPVTFAWVFEEFLFVPSP